MERRTSTLVEESFQSSCFREKADNRTSCYCNIFENVVSLCENSNALAHLDFSLHLFELVLTSFEQVMKILTLTGKETEESFLRQHSFSLSF